MTRLSVREIYDAAIDAGFDEHQAVTWTAIALAESGGNTRAHNPNGEDSRGLWQVNVRADRARATRYGDLYTARANAKAAYDISDRGRDMSPWTTTHDHNKGTGADYRTYLNDVEDEIGVQGDHRGVSGYGADPLKPLDYGGGTQARAAGAERPPIDPLPADPPKSDTDSDRDGLTDAFEDVAGTDPDKADTDGDGLSDGREALLTHTNPLSDDTDGDGETDAAEVKAGTDPGRLAGLAGVIGTGVFRERADQAKDTDRDGLTDHTEELIGTDPEKADTDRDRISDGAEASLGTNPLNPDTDADGVVDGVEVQFGSDPLTRSGKGVKQETVPRWTLEQGAADLARVEALPAQAPAGQVEEKQDHDDLDRVDFGGRTVDGRTAAMLQEAERLAQTEDSSIRDFRLAQGSWSHVKASAGTHGGPGAFDMGTDGYTEKQREIIGLALRRVGFASWRRRSYEGNWDEHWHGIAMGTEDLPPIARSQVESYRAGRNGLRNNGPDRDKRPKDPVTWEEYQRAHGTEPGQSSTYGGTDETRDSDRDGLTDAYEKKLGTEVDDKDSDDDGLSDVREVARTHTDPLSADTDSDGTDNQAEFRQSRDPGRVGSQGGAVGTAVAAKNAQGAKDSDSDGLSNRFEKKAGTDKDEADTDRDGLSDGMEAALGTDPTIADSDFDGLTDGLEVEHGLGPLSPTVDAAGRPVKITPWTAEAHKSSVTTTSYAIAHGGKLTEASRLPDAGKSDPDTDRDGLTDAFEKLAGTDPTKGDSDGDTIDDGTEATKTHTDPRSNDTDQDGQLDAAEVEAGTDPGRLPGVAGVFGRGIFAENIRDGFVDTDGDGLSDHTESLLGTKANRVDSDGDRLSDAMEVSLGTDPTIPDTDKDGLTDGFEVRHGSDPGMAWSAEPSSVAGDDVDPGHHADPADLVH